MKKALTIIAISLLCVSTLSILAPKVMGWASFLPSPLHGKMAYDALEGTGWSILDRAEIALHASYEGHIADYYHRVGQYQTKLHEYHVPGHDEECKCSEQGQFGGAEDGAYQYIQLAHWYYASGNKAEALKHLGYAIHFIQDSVCPPHVLPFSEHLSHTAHWAFEEYTADPNFGYGTIWNNWQFRVTTTTERLIESAGDLSDEVVNAANELYNKFEPPPSGFGYVRQDGVLIGDLSGTPFGWKMSATDIGWCMERAAGLVKGAALYVRAPTLLDVYMLVDLSGSFSDDLPIFKTQAPNLISNLKASNPNTQFGLGKFEDYPIAPFGSASWGDKAYERIIDLTSDTDAVLSCISALFTRSGADSPQSQLPALYQAATGAGQDLSGVGFPGASIPPGQQANFRDGAAKLFILWTDASFHNPGDPGTIPYPGPSFDQTVEAIKALDPPMVIGISSGYGGVADLRRMAIATGALAPAGGVDTNGDGTIDILEGEPLVCAISSSGYGIAEAIEALVEAAAILPTADANGPYEGEVGKAIILDGSGSFDSDGYIALYEWDFDGDGIFDFASTESATSHIYEAAFTGVVILRVTDDEGNTDTDEAAITIVQIDEIPPETWLAIGDPKRLIDETTFLTWTTPITLLAEDNLDGTGVASTSYRIYNPRYDSDWLAYTESFYFTGLSDSEYAIDFYSTDNAGNVESTNTQLVILENHLVNAWYEINLLREYIVSLYETGEIDQHKHDSLVVSLTESQNDVVNAINHLGIAKHGFDDKLEGLLALKSAVERLEYLKKDLRNWVTWGHMSSDLADEIIQHLQEINMALTEKAKCEAVAEKMLAVAAIEDAEARGRSLPWLWNQISYIDQYLADAEYWVGEGWLSKAVSYYKMAFYYSQRIAVNAWHWSWDIQPEDWIDQLEANL